MSVYGGMGVKNPDLDLERYTDWLCQGYDPENKINRKDLQDCVRLRRDFYEKFCRRAQ